MLLQDSSEEKVFSYLWEIETEYMGLEGNLERTRSFVRELFAIKLSLKSGN